MYAGVSFSYVLAYVFVESDCGEGEWIFFRGREGGLLSCYLSYLTLYSGERLVLFERERERWLVGWLVGWLVDP